MRVPKKLVSLLLTLALLFCAGGSALAAGVADATLPVPKGALPEGFRLTGLNRTDDAGKVWYCAESAPSKFGLTHVLWLDKNGEKASPAELPGVNYVPVGTETDFPSRYDAREEGLVSPVEDQIGGTCWAHAAAAVMETAAAKKGIYGAGELNISEYHIVWNTYHGYEEGVSDSRNDGEKPYAYADILNRGGNYDAVARAAFNGEGPADERRYGLDEDLDAEAFYKEEMVKTFNFTNRYDRDLAVTGTMLFDSTVEGIKTAVSTFGAAQISYYAATDDDVCYPEEGTRLTVREADYFNFIWGWSDETRPCAYYFPYRIYSNHAVTVVGWDDGFSRENFNEKNRPEHDGAFLVKNSWSTDFGNDGFFWISYDDPTVGEVIAYDVAPAEDYQLLHSHTGYTAEKSFSGTNQATKLRAAANVFTADRDELLTAVSGGQKTSGTLAVAVYGDLPENVTDPTAGTLLFEGTLQGNGSIWLPLPSPVAVPAGQRFSVVFTDVSSIGTEGNNIPGSSGGSPVYFTSHPGESFVLLNEKWRDLNTIESMNGDRFNNAAISVAARLAPTARPRVTFTCPGHYSSTVEADENGNVPLPTTEGHVWAITDRGAPFTGTGVTGDMTVTAHCYPEKGEISADCLCVTLYRCVYCGREVRERLEEHDWQWITDEEPTCIFNGRMHEECLNCGSRRGEDVYIEPTGVHQYIWRTSAEPTCGSVGYQYRWCTVCGATADENTEIPATGNHSWDWITEIYPTCGSDGLKAEYCGGCGARRNETVLPATGDHSWDWITDLQPNACIPGLQHRYCLTCGQEDSFNTPIPGGDHVFDWVTDRAPTCTSDGEEHEACRYCGTVRGRRIPSAKGHSYEQWSRREPTCVEEGSITWRCPDCGDTYDESLGMGPHEPSGWIVDPAPTATSDGERSIFCTVCGEVLQRERVPKTGETGIRRGDVDFDGDITAADARLALRRAVELETFAEGSAQFVACDADRDNAVTAADARRILRAAVSLEDPADW